MARLVGRRLRWSVVAVAVLGVAGYALGDRLAAVWPQPTQAADVSAERPAQPVRVTVVAFSAVDATETYTGTLRPREEAALGFRLPGKLVARLVEVGDRVVAGQALARLDDTDARLELEQAIAEAEAAATDLIRAEAEAIRSQSLFAKGHVSQALLDRVTSAWAEARARVERAGRARDLAENRLSYTLLVAEAAGVVTATPAEAGQVVAAGQPVVVVARTDGLDVVFALPEDARAGLDRAVASATLWGAEDRPYALRLRDISPDVDAVGRTYRVRMALVAPDDAAALGRTATVLLTSPDAAPVATLPLAAVLNDGSGTGVWRVSKTGDGVERVAVDLVLVDGMVAQVRGGLRDGDRIVSLGAHKVDPARPVRVVETAPAPES